MGLIVFRFCISNYLLSEGTFVISKRKRTSYPAIQLNNYDHLSSVLVPVFCVSVFFAPFLCEHQSYVPVIPSPVICSRYANTLAEPANIAFSLVRFYSIKVASKIFQ